MIPAYIDYDFNEVTPEICNAVLVRVVAGAKYLSKVPAPQLINGESVLCFGIEFNGGVAFYAILCEVSMFTPKTMAQVGAALSGNFRTGITENSAVDYYDSLLSHKGMDMRIVTDWQDIMKDLVIEHITQDHHFFVNRQEFQIAYNSADVDTKKLCCAVHMWLLRIGNNLRVSHITFMMYAILTSDLGRDMILYFTMNSNSVDEAISVMKLESQSAKQLQRYVRDDLSVIFEMQVLWNRMDTGVDWEKELHNRTVTNTVDVLPNEVMNIAMKLFYEAEAQGLRPKKKTWDDYWAMRWSTMPNGSVVSQYAEDRELKKALPREAKVKSAWFAALNKLLFEHWKRRDPLIYASTSTKYEWGKVRALYGCDVTSFAMADFSMGDADECLPQQFPVGTKANEKFVRRVTEKMKNSVPFCFDYDDFNSQHSTRSMMSVIEAWIVVFQKYLSDEQVQALKWTLKSLTDVKVKFTELEKTMSINGTLLSGWRLTSFMNTVLNRVYLEMAGLKLNVVHALHNGDDMYACTLNVQNAVNILGKAKLIGIRAQAAKMNVGTIGEFLRVDARALKPSGAQYLTRSVATMVHGRVEVGKPNDFFALIKATDVRYKEVEDRGGNKDILVKVKERAVSFIKSMFGVSDIVLEKYYELHPLQGGNNLKTSAQDVRIVLESEVVNERILHNKYKVCTPGMLDYLQYVVKKYGLHTVSVSSRLYLTKAMLSLERQKIGYVLVNESRSKVGNYIGMYRAWHKSGYVAEITKVRTAGLVAAQQLPGVNSIPAHLIRNAQEPLEFMKAIL